MRRRQSAWVSRRRFSWQAGFEHARWWRAVRGSGWNQTWQYGHGLFLGFGRIRALYAHPFTSTKNSATTTCPTSRTTQAVNF